MLVLADSMLERDRTSRADLGRVVDVLARYAEHDETTAVGEDDSRTSRLPEVGRLPAA